MKFHDYAANETSLLISRLLAKRSKKASSDLQGFRHALDEAARALEATLGASAKPEQDDEVANVIERLTAAATQQAQAMVDRAKAEAKPALEEARKELAEQVKEKEALTSSLQQARAQGDGLRQQFQAQKDRADAARTECVKAQEALTAADAACRAAEGAQQEEARAKALVDGERKELRAALDAARAEAARGAKQLEAGAAEKAKLAAALEAAKAKLDATGANLAAAQSKLDATEANRAAAQSKLDATEANRAAVQSKLDAAAANLVAAQSKLDTMQARLKASDDERQTLAMKVKASASHIESLDRASAEHERTRRDLEARLDTTAAAEAALRQRVTAAERELGHMRDREATSASLPLDRLLAVFNTLATGTTVDDVMMMIAAGLATDFSRVALFNVNGKRLEGVHQIGFDSKTDISKVAIPLTMDSLLARAVSAGRVEVLTVTELHDPTSAPFGGTPSSMLALPVTVRDETLAVIYADDSDQPETDGNNLEQRTKFAELLRQHAVPILEKLTVPPKLLEELRAYATMLVDEIEHMYAADVSAAKKGAELKSRLKANLQCAREIYAQRVALEGPAAAAVLEERLAAVIEARTSTPFGKDLASIAERPEPARKQASSRAAGQAS